MRADVVPPGRWGWIETGEAFLTLVRGIGIRCRRGTRGIESRDLVRCARPTVRAKVLAELPLVLGAKAGGIPGRRGGVLAEACNTSGG